MRGGLLSILFFCSSFAVSAAQFPDLFGFFGASKTKPPTDTNAECSAFDGGIQMCAYDNYDHLLTRLNRIAADFPHLAQLGSAGKSSQGRQLAFIKLSSNVTSRSPLEPMFKYIGNMHGDEALGRQLILYLAEYMVRHYDRDPRVRDLLDSTEIFLMPSMNPDGFDASSEGTCQPTVPFFGLVKSPRNNAQNVDLNRDFPKRFEDAHLTSFEALAKDRQPETVAMMRWILSQPFVLSANMHAGTVVASYPFDDSERHVSEGFYSASPDDQFFRYVSKLYASKHAFMHQGAPCRGDRFPEGITNGAHWYDVPGGMQDFNYVHSNCFEITLELSCCRHPDSTTLLQEWLNNKEALLAYMEAVHMGVKGMVLDEDGLPVSQAAILVKGNEKVIRATDNGEFWRLLPPGQFELQAQAQGYHPSEPFVAVVQPAPPASRPRALLHTFVLRKK